jgi:hypothetical protein
MCALKGSTLLQTWWLIYSAHRFSILLVILIGLLTGPSLVQTFGHETKWYDLLMAFLMLAAILSLCFETHQRVFAIVFGVPAILFVLIGHSLSGAFSASSLLLAQLCEIIFFLGAAALIVRSLFSRTEVSFDSILGAVCGYLFVGLGWAICYAIIEGFHPGSFAVSQTVVRPTGDSPLLPQLLIYYSFITLTTVGYGDITPASSGARSLAWMEAITGQFYLAVIVAALVTLITAKHGQSRDRN